MLLIAAGIMVAAIIMLPRVLDKRIRYRSSVVSKDQLQAIMDDREYDESMIKGLVFDGQLLNKDNARDYYLYSITRGEKESFNPGISVISDSKDVRISFDKVLTSEEIRQSADIHFVVYNDDRYCSGIIKCTTLPIMNIVTNGAMVEGKGFPMEMRMELYDNRQGVTDRTQISYGTMSVRGNASLENPKKNYRLRLMTDVDHKKDNKLSLLGMRKDDDWVLYALYEDPEKVRNVFCTNLWNNSCADDNNERINTGTEYEYLEVFFNGEYAGLYALGYPIQDKQLRSSRKSQNAAIFKAQGGYSGIIPFYADGTTSKYEMTGDQSDSRWKLLRNYYTEMCIHDDDIGYLEGMIDIDNAIDFRLFVNLIQGVDNVDANRDLFISYDDRGRLKALNIPWDMDQSFGGDVGGEFGFYEMSFDYNYEFNKEALYLLIYNDAPGIRQRVKNKYKKLRATYWSDETILGMIDKYEEDVFESGAYYREKKKWPEADYIDPADEMTKFKKYVIKRLEYLDSYIPDDANWEIDGRYSDNVVGTADMAGLVMFTGDRPDRITILEINNPDVWEEDRYKAFFENVGIDIAAAKDRLTLEENLGSLGVDVHEAVNSGNPPILIIVDGSDMSYWLGYGGTPSLVADTQIGEISCFDMGDGSGYAYYLDGEEMIIDSNVVSDTESGDVRIISVTRDTKESYYTGEFNLVNLE